MSALPTVRIESEAHAQYGGFVEINESDFDPKIHTLFLQGIQAPADGTLSESITGDGSGKALPPMKRQYTRKAKE